MKEKNRLAFLILLLGGVSLVPTLGGCAGREENARDNHENVAVETPLHAPTEAQAIEFAHALEERLKNGDSAFFVRAVDWSALTDRVLRGIPQTADGENLNESGAKNVNPNGPEPASKSSADRFDRRYLISLFSEKGGIAQSVAEKVRQGGTYHFLRVKRIDDGSLALTFRLVDADGGLDYHDLYLEHKAGGLVQIYEFYLYHFDETFSETLRRTLVPNLYLDGADDYGTIASELIILLHKENKLLIQEFSTAFEEKKAQRALDLFDQLPRELRNLKTFQLWRLKAAQLHPDPAVYSFVFADIRQKYVQEGWVDFLSLDYFFNRREFQNALACINHIDALVGGDPYLDSFRCWAYLNLENIPEAQRRFDDALAKEPDLAEDRSFTSLKKRLESVKINPADADQEINPFRRPVNLKCLE